jgi:uncharacterized protein
MAGKVWFKDGLQFECTQCGDCCTGAPGYVWVNAAEIADLANHLQMPIAEFEQKFVRNIGIRKSLIEYENGDCVFFDNKARNCTVYEARPRQCKTWPFWDSNINSPRSWKQTCQACPGSGTGKLYTVDEILAKAAIVRV